MQAHVVARTYLSGFARKKGEPKGVVVFDRRHPVDAQVALQHVVDARRVSLVEDFYIFERAAGKDDFVERGLSLIENVWPKLKIALKRGDELSKDELGLLALFAAMCEGRAPRNRLMFEKPMKQMLEIVDYHYRARGFSEEDTADGKRRFIAENFYAGDAVHDPRNLSLIAVPEHVKQSYEWFRRMHKMVLTSNGSDFFTSDHPVVWFDPAICEEGHPCPSRLSLTAEVTFPLNRRQCLVMAFTPLESRAEADEECVHVVNARTARYALQQVYAYPAIGKPEMETQLRHLTDVGFGVVAKPLCLRYGDEHGDPNFDMHGLIDALGGEWEWVLESNKHVQELADAIASGNA